jgi:hypothetical protein
VFKGSKDAPKETRMNTTETAPAKKTNRTTISAVTVDTRPYFRSHLREPRGTGSWAFQIGRDEENLFWHNGTYGEARKAAQAEARRRGATIIYAQP